LGGKEILWEKRNFGDCKRIFEQAVVEALHSHSDAVRPHYQTWRQQYFILRTYKLRLSTSCYYRKGRCCRIPI
jgi:coproporphyrinogen III oxidase